MTLDPVLTFDEFMASDVFHYVEFSSSNFFCGVRDDEGGTLMRIYDPAASGQGIRQGYSFKDRSQRGPGPELQQLSLLTKVFWGSRA